MQDHGKASSKNAALEMLPKTHAIHWVARRKAQVVKAVRRGWLSFDEACSRYKLSFEEFLEWQRAFSDEGVGGLRSSQLNRHHRSGQRQRAH